MGKESEIKSRMKAIANIERITKTMQMIATARFQSSQRDAVAAKPFTEKIAELVGELAGAVGGDESSAGHPLLRESTGEGKRLLLVLSSNRGLCGGYNAQVLRAAGAFLREHSEQGVEVEVVGKKANAYFRFRRQPVIAYHEQFGDKPDYAASEQLARRYIERFSNGDYDAIDVAYMQFESVGRQIATVTTLLPLADPLADESAGGSSYAAEVIYDFSPNPAELLEELLPLTVKTRLFQCFNEAIVSEHIARMIAMKNATDAAGKMSKTLTRQYNRARQTAITTELTEIISGAAALG